jgi:predicted metal-dependent hydrolase
MQIDLLPTISTHPRAKRLSLRLVSKPPHVRMTVPSHVDMEEAMAFYHEKKQWVTTRLAQIFATQPSLAEAAIRFWGEPIRVESTGNLRDTSYLQESVLYVGGEAAHQKRRVDAFLQHSLLTHIQTQVATYAAELGVRYQEIRVKNMHSRYGSCSSQGNLAFTRYLISAPKDAVNYVVAHEVAHLREMNHSPRFWKHVATLCPDYARHRAWFKDHGKRLFGR